MLFSSIFFIFIFLPVLILCYYLIDRNYKNYLLLLFSLVFYSWGGVSYTIILISSILLNFFLVKRIEKRAHAKKWLYFGLFINLLVIVVFKYLDFIIDNINFIGSISTNKFQEIPFFNIVLPLGISFFTFQQMSLLWDVYRDENKEKTSLTSTALYISLFPQLIAGPIVRYDDIIDQINKRVETLVLFNSGIKRFIIGLFKKIIIANSFGAIADSIIDLPSNEISTSVAWLGIVSYSIQIFFDFSGYSDMAIGLGRMFGFRILENFNFPYIATSIQDFWKRWHISLSTWFRDYVYIPLGGSRLSNSRTYLNLLIVFVLTGFWHGATWSFMVWGLFHGLFLMLEKAGLSSLLKRLPKIINWAYTMLVVLIAWVLFRIENISDAVDYIARLFVSNPNSPNFFIEYLNYEVIFNFGLALLLGTPTLYNLHLKLVSSSNEILNKTYSIFIELMVISMFIYTLFYIVSGTFNPFIYFRF